MFHEINHPFQETPSSLLKKQTTNPTKPKRLRKLIATCLVQPDGPKHGKNNWIICVCSQMHMYTYMLICIYIYMYKLYIYIYICKYICKYICIYVNINNIYICVYIYSCFLNIMYTHGICSVKYTQKVCIYIYM